MAFRSLVQGLTFSPLSLGKHVLLNMVTVNIAGWGYLIKMHSYMMPQLNMYVTYPDIPSVTVPITET